jgi:hypothetical protein
MDGVLTDHINIHGSISPAITPDVLLYFCCHARKSFLMQCNHIAL